MIYLTLFLTFFKIGIFSFGGGYAMLSLIQSEVVVANPWITSGEFTDIVAISQMTPGPISINCATYIGYKATGSALGSTVATLGICAPSFILMLIASILFAKLKHNPMIKSVMRSLRPIIIGLILSAAILLYTPDNFIDPYSYIIFAIALVLVILKVSPIYVILLSGLAGYLIY